MDITYGLCIYVAYFATARTVDLTVRYVRAKRRQTRESSPTSF